MSDILKQFVGTLPVYILIVVMFFFLYDGDKLSTKDLLRELNQRDSIISRIIDDQGRLITTHTNREFSPTTIINSDRSDFVELRRELKDLGIKVKDLKASYNLSVQTTGEGQTEIVRVHDTLDTYTFSDTTGKYLKLNGIVDVSSGLMDYDYTYSANYKLYSYEYKKKFWKRPELRMKIISDDPNSDIQLQTFTVKPPRELFSIGVGLGVSATYANGKMYVGPSASIGIYKSIYTFRTKK